MRRLIGIVLGIVLANLFIWGWETLVLPLTPFHPGFAPGGLEQGRATDPAPLAAQAWVAAGWTLGAFVGALVAFRIAHSDLTGWIVAGVVGALSVANVLVIDHPLWMRLWAVAGPFVGALFAFGIWRRMRAALLHLHHN